MGRMKQAGEEAWSGQGTSTRRIKVEGGGIKRVEYEGLEDAVYRQQEEEEELENRPVW